MKSKLLILVAVVGLFAGYVIAAEQGSMKMDEPMDAAMEEGMDMTSDMDESMNAMTEETANAVEDMGETMDPMMDKAVEGEAAK